MAETPEVTTSQDPRHSVVDVRRKFTRPFLYIFGSAFVLIVAYSIATLVMTLIGYQRGTDDSYMGIVDLLAQQNHMLFTVRLLQLSLAMIIGFFAMFLGVIVAWMGIEAKFEISGETENVSVVIASASPGILLIISGTLLISFAVFNPITAEQVTIQPASVGLDLQPRRVEFPAFIPPKSDDESQPKD